MSALESYTPTALVAPEGRRELLARTIHTMTVEGFRVESQSDYQAVLVKGHRVNHLLHAILSILTLVWFAVWITLALTGGEKREIASVDEFGHVNRESI